MRFNYWQTLTEGSYYHIYNRTINQETLFKDYPDRHYFLKQWHSYLGNYLDTYAYCLMANHFHFIVQVKTVDNHFRDSVRKENTVAAVSFLNDEKDLNTFLEDQFKRFFSSLAHTFNKKYKRHGSVFQKRFKRIELVTLAQILNKICYTHHNPLHHNAAYEYVAWEFSSYKAYISNKITKVNRTEGLKLFDELGRVDTFISYHKGFHENWVQDQKWRDFHEKGF